MNNTLSFIWLLLCECKLCEDMLITSEIIRLLWTLWELWDRYEITMTVYEHTMARLWQTVRHYDFMKDYDSTVW